MTPTPRLDTYAMRPWVSAPGIGDGLCCGALVEPLHAASTNAVISTSERARSNRAMSLGTLTRVTRDRFRALRQRDQTNPRRCDLDSPPPGLRLPRLPRLHTPDHPDPHSPYS